VSTVSRYLMMVMTDPKPGRDDEYNHWYDEQHLDDLCAINGILSAVRYEIANTSEPQYPTHRWLALYEVETDDIDKLRENIHAKAESGAIFVSDAVDRDRVSVLMWKQHGEVHRAARSVKITQS
jgi:hypothetical protein